MKWLLARLSEPSTHAAITGLIGVAMPFIPAQYQPIAQVAAVIFGGAGVATSEKKVTAPTP